MNAIGILKQDRALIARILAGLRGEQLLTIPEGFGNNILWNLGHIVVTQQILHYRLAGLESYLPEELIGQCRTGTSPANWSAPPDVEALELRLHELPDRLEADYRAGRFAGFKPYTTSTGIALADIDDAIGFNNFHEGLHMGVILAMKRLVT